ncbi:MAG: hypothetical protein M1338_05510 [Patescibacteria group bacterium]|nr:hypothetical protein [Patescibacteria group bacterium]
MLEIENFCHFAYQLIKLFVARDLEIVDDLTEAGEMNIIIARMWDQLQTHYEECPRCREAHFRIYSIMDEQLSLGAV